MKSKSYIALSACFFITACASGPTGPAYSSTNLPKPETGKAQLVIFQPDFWGVTHAPLVKVNGVETCKLPPKSFFVMDVDPNNIIVIANLWDFPGVSRLNFKAKPKERYFIKVEFYQENANPGVLFGAVGGAIGGALSAANEPEHTGPFIIQRIYEDVASSILKNSAKTVDCQVNTK